VNDVLPAAPDGRRAAVVNEADLAMRPFAAAGPGMDATFREPIDEATDCRQLIQRVIRLGPGRTAEMRHERSDDVVYLVEGAATATVDGERFDLEPATALFVPEASTYRFDIHDGQRPLLVSVLSPPPARDHEMGHGSGARPAVTRDRDQEPLPAGDDRSFKLMIDPRFGCHTVTQFLGFIERSRAPYHTHTYEEVIYILGGEGVVHIDDRHVPIRAGTSIFLPPGVPHCLENVSRDVLRLLGVFSPAGSPANKAGVPGA
jgi:mannose-6-phosphate isomerase-like protein (cupin superfamily)